MEQSAVTLARAATGALVLWTISGTCGYAVTNVPTHPVRVTSCAPMQATVAPRAAYSPNYKTTAPFNIWYDTYGHQVYEPRVNTTETILAINYRNDTQYPMKEVQFGLVTSGRLLAEVRDIGHFSPQTEIKHEFGLRPHVYPAQGAGGPPRCVPLAVTFADGTKWVNPNRPALQASVYEHP